MKKLEDMVNYLNTAPFWNYAAIAYGGFVARDVMNGDLKTAAVDSAILAMDALFGYADFKNYKEIKIALKKGWDEEEVDTFVRTSGIFSKYIARRAAKQTGYTKEFDELAERRGYKFLSIFNSKGEK